ncbi:MAG: extracellular solute-binding protein [Proteobacteria bacterium]|nr:extracellular solute-binding protein [Pseudomonadota bacterium]
MSRSLLVLSLALSLVFVACSGGDTTPDAPAPDSDAPAADAAPEVTGKVVVLSSRDEKFMRPLWDLVAAKHPKLELVVDYGKDAAYLDRIRAEGDAPQADLFVSKASAAVTAAAADGLLAPLPEEILARVPEKFRGTGGRWVGLSARARIIVARRLLGNKPLSITDLASSRFEGRVARTVATNESFVGGIAALLSDLGESGTRDFLRALDTNSKGNVHPKHTPAVAAVAEGTADLALVNHYYFYRNVLGKQPDPNMTVSQAEGLLAEAPIEAIWPDADGAGTAWNVSGAGVIEGAAHPEQAQALLEVLLSEEGQKAYAWSNREYPVVDGVASPPGVRAADSFTWSETSLTELAANNEAAVALIQEIGLE